MIATNRRTFPRLSQLVVVAVLAVGVVVDSTEAASFFERFWRRDPKPKPALPSDDEVVHGALNHEEARYQVHRHLRNRHGAAPADVYAHGDLRRLQDDHKEAYEDAARRALKLKTEREANGWWYRLKRFFGWYRPLPVPSPVSSRRGSSRQTSHRSSATRRVPKTPPASGSPKRTPVWKKYAHELPGHEATQGETQPLLHHGGAPPEDNDDDHVPDVNEDDEGREEEHVEEKEEAEESPRQSYKGANRVPLRYRDPYYAEFGNARAVHNTLKQYGDIERRAFSRSDVQAFGEVTTACVKETMDEHRTTARLADLTEREARDILFQSAEDVVDGNRLPCVECDGITDVAVCMTPHVDDDYYGPRYGNIFDAALVHAPSKVRSSRAVHSRNNNNHFLLRDNFADRLERSGWLSSGNGDGDDDVVPMVCVVQCSRYVVFCPCHVYEEDEDEDEDRQDEDEANVAWRRIWSPRGPLNVKRAQ